MKNVLANAIVLKVKYQGEHDRAKGGLWSYTRVKEPTCCSVSRMNNWPKAPMIANRPGEPSES